MEILILYKARRLFIGTILLTLFFVNPLQAQTTAALQLYEQKIKASLVYNFLKSTSWPDFPQAKNETSIKICLFGGDPFDGYLYPLEGRTAQRHVITIIQTNSLRQVDDCHILFIHRDQKRFLGDILKYLDSKSILTMSDMEGFSRRGGMVELATQKDQRVHLLINKNAVEYAGLDIEQSMMKLAQLVE